MSLPYHMLADSESGPLKATSATTVRPCPGTESTDAVTRSVSLGHGAKPLPPVSWQTESRAAAPGTGPLRVTELQC